MSSLGVIVANSTFWSLFVCVSSFLAPSLSFGFSLVSGLGFGGLGLWGLGVSFCGVGLTSFRPIQSMQVGYRFNMGRRDLIGCVLWAHFSPKGRCTCSAMHPVICLLFSPAHPRRRGVYSLTSRNSIIRPIPTSVCCRPCCRRMHNSTTDNVLVVLIICATAADIQDFIL